MAKTWILGLVALFATVSPSEAAILRYDVTASTVFASNIGRFLPPDQRTQVDGSLTGFFLYDTTSEQVTKSSLFFKGDIPAVQTTFDTIITNDRIGPVAASSTFGQGPGAPLLSFILGESLPRSGASSPGPISLTEMSPDFTSYTLYSIILRSSPGGGGVVSTRVFDIAGTITPTAVPLPPAGLALLAALGGFVALRRRPKIAVCPFKSGS